MISQAVEYSLRAMVLLAQCEGGPLTVQAIAEKGQISPHYLSKILQGLARGDLVRAQRGVKGGYLLRRPPEAITLADIMNSVEPLQRIRKCPLGIGGHADLCPLHKKLDHALAYVEETFRSTTLKDLCQSAPPLCPSNVASHVEFSRS